MTRDGFSMIELIIVIIILGILSAIAIPKYLLLADSSKAAKCKALVGTINRSVLPALWSAAVTSKGDTSVNDYNEANISSLINIPKECGDAGKYADAIHGTSFSLSFGSAEYNISLAVIPDKNRPPSLNWIER